MLSLRKKLNLDFSTDTTDIDDLKKEPKVKIVVGNSLIELEIKINKVLTQINEFDLIDINIMTDTFNLSTDKNKSYIGIIKYLEVV